MPKRKKYTFATTDLGCPHPDEYALKYQMDQYCAIYDNGMEPFIKTDAGKFIGLAKAYLYIKEAVDDFLVVDFIAVENGDYQAALGKAVAFNTQVHLDSRVNGGSVMLDPDEVSIVNKLLAGYVVGPEGQKVLDKLRQTS